MTRSRKQGFPFQQQKPTFRSTGEARLHLAGFLGQRLQANIDQWVLPAPGANPAMIEMFLDRDRLPRRPLVPWAGEFAGKYLTAAVNLLRLSRDRRLRTHLDRFVDALIAGQAPDGYLGPAPRDHRLTGWTHDGRGRLWDVWGHYHCMLGLLLWHEATGHRPARRACRKAADYICSRFLDGPERAIHAGAEEMNLAVAHVFCLLYQKTGHERYRQMIRELEQDWQTPPAGDYVRTALAGVPFHQTPKPRWESLHDIQAVGELYYITGEASYRRAFEHIYRSLVAGDRHNTGGFSSGEKATGNPYDPGAIETCCTVAYLALSVDMLRMSGEASVADEIELATFNAGLGAQHPSGRWWTYNTPMDGLRKASAHEIVFQAAPGSPELNCCSVNGPRVLGLLADWAVMQTDDGLVLNYYGPGTIAAPLPAGGRVTWRQITDYPADGRVRVEVRPSRTATFTLRLRIPVWSARTRVKVNGRPVRGVSAGTYLALKRAWRAGDAIDLEFDMSVHFWVGRQECQGRASLYTGPILLAYDPRYNTMDPADVPAIQAERLRLRPATWERPPRPWLLRRVTAADGRDLVLCDFASAGACGQAYRTWLVVRGLEHEGLTDPGVIWAARPKR